MLDAEHFSGSRKAGLHLVRDEKNAVPVTERAKRFEEFAWGGMKAALTLNRLDDEGGDVFRSDVGPEKIIEGLQRIGDTRAMLRHGKRHMKDAGGEMPNLIL